MSKIVSVNTTDVRFPTSLELDGSDAVNVDPDYSAPTWKSLPEEKGCGLVFTCAEGNDWSLLQWKDYGDLLLGRETEN